MPVPITFPGFNRFTTVIATKEELLEFANKVREAGGGEIIPDLLPSSPAMANSCLIANALNFKCTVSHGLKHYDDHDGSSVETTRDYSWLWYMTVLDKNLANTISQKLGLLCTDFRIFLPKHIGNTAHAFDLGLAFQEYAIVSD